MYMEQQYTFLDFFAGSGLVTEGVKPYFKTIWANDVSEKKAAIYYANHEKDNFILKDIKEIKGIDVPSGVVSWASFPCQDLGLVWQWIRIIDEMEKKPPIVVAENVTGLVSANNGEYYKKIHKALIERDYRVGCIILDASLWLPQSRKRVFVIGVKKQVDLYALYTNKPTWLHNENIKNIANSVEDWVWWDMPRPPTRKIHLDDIVDFNIQCEDNGVAKKNLSLIPPTHMTKLRLALRKGAKSAVGYRRIRKGKQVMEIRADGTAGCLRTGNGGSSRQFLIILKEDKFQIRLVTVREAARLMGAPDVYEIPGSYNEGYHAMGDAVALPVTQYLTNNLLLPLARRIDD
jgi:DNA (cytosine-5)-methyltransferase 1